MLQLVDPFPDHILSNFNTDAVSVIANLRPGLELSQVGGFARNIADLTALLPEGARGLRGIYAAKFFLEAGPDARKAIAKFQLVRHEAEARSRGLVRAVVIARCLISFYEHQQVGAPLRGQLRDLSQMLATTEQKLADGLRELNDNLPEFPTFQLAYSDAVGLSLVQS